MSVRIHPTAIIDKRAELDSSVEVGPYAVIGAGVSIGARTHIGSHAVLSGPMRIGSDNRIFAHAALGAISQDKTAKDDDPTSVVIGDGNTIREFVTIQRGTMKEFDIKRGQTRLGDRNWIMNYCHIAHDCQIGSDTVFANNASLAGHVQIGDWVVLGGYTLVYQFCRIGAHAFTAFSAGVAGDVPPFVMVQGNPAEPRAINKEGLRRRQFDPADVAAIEDAYKLIYRSGKLIADIRREMEPLAEANKQVGLMLEFLLGAKRPLAR